MPAPLVASVSLVFTSKGLRTAIGLLRRMTAKLGGVRKNMFALGVTTIFVDRLIQSFTRAWRALNTVIGVGRVAQAAADFQRISEFTRVGTVRLQAFTAVAQEVGAEINDVADLFSTLSERVDDLRSGKGSVTEDFAILGISKGSFAGLDDGYSQFLVVADAMARAQDTSKRLSFGEKILGGDINRKFGALVEGGVANLQDLQLEALATGEIMTKAELEIGRQYSRSSLRLRRVFTAISNQLSMTVMDPLRKTIDLISMVGFKVGKFLRESSQIRDTIAMVFDPLYDKTRNFLTWWDNSVKGLGPTVLRIGVALAGVAAIAQAPQLAILATTFRSIFFFAKWGGLAIEDLIGYLSGLGGPSLFGKLLPASPILQEFRDAFVTLAGTVQMGLSSMGRSLKVFFTGPLGVATLRGVFASIKGLGFLFLGLALAIEGVVRAGNAVVAIFQTLDNSVGLKALLGNGGGGLSWADLPANIAGGVAPELFGMTPYAREAAGPQISSVVNNATTVQVTGSNAGPLAQSTVGGRMSANIAAMGAQ